MLPLHNGDEGIRTPKTLVLSQLPMPIRVHPHLSTGGGTWTRKSSVLSRFPMPIRIHLHLSCLGWIRTNEMVASKATVFNLLTTRHYKYRRWDLNPQITDFESVSYAIRILRQINASGETRTHNPHPAGGFKPPMYANSITLAQNSTSGSISYDLS